MRIIAARKNYLTNCRSTAILDTVMNYYLLVENLIKEHARGYRDEKQTLDGFFVELRNAVEQELELTPLSERMKDYDEYNDWDDA